MIGNEIEFHHSDVKLQSLKQWKDDVVESLCKYDAESVEEVYQLGIKKGRADAINDAVSEIEEILKWYIENKNKISNVKICIVLDDFEYLIKKLKEKK